MLNLIRMFTASRSCWVLLFLFAAAMEGCGLYFQYGLRLDPCVECVYERAFLLGFVLAALIGFLAPGSAFMRFTASLVLFLSSGFGLKTALEHNSFSVSSSQAFGKVCKLTADFPSFLKLDEWLPWMFKPTGSCGPLPWEFLGLSMPQWLVTIFGCGLIAAVVMLISQFSKKRKNYSELYR